MNLDQIFSNLKIIELASVLAGPSVGQFFAELGAEVVKVENPSTNGDVTRSWKLSSEDPNAKFSSYFAAANWGKQHVFKDLKSEEDRAEVYEMIQEADVVITSFKPGDAEKLGFDYNVLRKLNERIIYGSISGYGATDLRTGYDAVIQAETGFMYMNGEPGTAPTKMPVAMMDLLAAHQLKEGILVGLLKRNDSGIGCRVDVSLFDSGISALCNQATNYLVANKIAQQMGSDHPNIVPYGTIFSTKDHKNLVLAIGSDRQFKKLCEILGVQSLALEERFSTNIARVRHRTEVKDLIQMEVKKWLRNELLEELKNSKVPAGAVNNIQEVFEVEDAQRMILNYPKNEESKLRGIKNVAFRIRD